VDDEPSILHFFSRAFQEPKVTLVTAQSAAEGLEKASIAKPDVIILDVDLSGLSGIELFRHIQKLDSRTPVIFITGHGTTATAIEAIQLGAYEYLLKPLELDQLLGLVDRAFEISRLMKIPPVISEGPEILDAPDALVGRCPAMQSVYKSIGRVAMRDVTVLILGESGTGKELVARAIYHHSLRAKAQFLAINCAAIPDALLESELFGHEKGAFTNADRRRIGKFEQCNRGTLFLDEIGDMSPVTQTKILRVLQGEDFERVGGNEAIHSNVRVITATNRDLENMVAAGTFRGDLYYRLNVFTIRLPPLRERGEDVPLLARHFVNRFAKELGKTVQSIDEKAMLMLMQYTWPGNVREFQSVIKQTLLHTTGPVLLPEFLPEIIQNRSDKKANIPVEQTRWTDFIKQRLSDDSTSLYAEFQAVTDRHLVTLVLEHTGGNFTQAARILGISRQTLRVKLRELGLDDDQASAAAKET
jgi:DNA-binding NtrC family response regulator